MRVRFFGNAAVSLHHENTCLLIDPWFAGEEWFRPSPFTPVIPPDLKPDLLLVTHGHGDHLDDAIGLSQRLGVPICPRGSSPHTVLDGEPERMAASQAARASSTGEASR